MVRKDMRMLQNLCDSGHDVIIGVRPGKIFLIKQKEDGI